MHENERLLERRVGGGRAMGDDADDAVDADAGERCWMMGKVGVYMSVLNFQLLLCKPFSTALFLVFWYSQSTHHPPNTTKGIRIRSLVIRW